ncbi:MAG TPA: antibiotic biosynthesis monooxygenase [Bacillota bacterium]|nr:antibiotic biosynthesis monooxygenase [Bacillota bacterium]
MKAFMTNGTIDFLQKLNLNYPDISFSLMSNSAGALAYYEGNKKNIFSAGRVYDIIATIGEIGEEGYVVMNNIPITDEGKPIFEDAFKKQQQVVESMPGFKAFRLLKPTKGNTYVVFTQWESEIYFNHWKDSDEFKQAHADQATMSPAYFAERPFINKYYMVIED